MEASSKAGAAATEQASRPPQNVWSRNPLTSRPSNQPAPAQNGVTPSTTPRPAQQRQAKETKKESATSDKHANDRLTFLLANFTGLQCTVALRNGERYAGIFSGSSLDTSEAHYVLKMVKRADPSNNQQANGIPEASDEYIGHGEDHAMSFDVQDVTDLNCASVTMSQNRARGQNGTAASFRTDVDISGNLAMRERELKRWEPSNETNVDLSLGSGDAGGWDQFAENKRLYGVNSNYNEELYTTKIDRSKPEYAKIAAEAERKAREIEGSSAMNSHVAEERGQKSLDDSGLDEEEKYSGVRRDYSPLSTGNQNSYVPPSRRQAPDPKTASLLNDPAILNASTVKPATPQATREEKEPTARPAEVGKEKAVTASVPKAPAANAELKNGPTKEDRKPAEPVKRNPDNATETVERDLNEAFKQFASSEKALYKTHQRDRLNKDKQMKINELKKFAHNFKLNTPVPQDLVPILAKDERKQKEIMDKAKQAADEAKSAPTKPAPSTAPVPEQKAPRQPSGQVPQSPADRGSQARRPGQDNRPPVSYNRGIPGPSVQRPGNLTQRIGSHRGMQMPHMPVPTPIQTGLPPQGPSGAHSGMQSPSSAVSTRFNVGAREFRPNPAANTFSPNLNLSTSSSPRHDSTRPVSKGFADIWEGRAPPPPTDQHIPITDFFNAIPRLTKEAEADGSKSKFEKNGGIPWAYSTPPSWNTPEANINISYAQMFEKLGAVVAPLPSPHHMIPQNGPGPYQHQLPLHLQNGPIGHQGHTPHQTPRHMAAQPHAGQHFDEQMRFSQSQSSVQPSPQPHRIMVQGPNGPQMVQAMPYGINAQGQPVAFRPLPGGMAPQFVGQQPMMMGGHVMVPQSSNGPFMQVNPQMAVYQQSPVPGHVYPQQGGAMPAQMQMQGPQMVPNGYPSPGHRAPMMQQQGSQQGHMPGGHGQPLMFPGQGMQMFPGTPNGPMTPMRGHYAQPHQGTPYGTSPHQQYQQGPHRGTPSAQYAQPMMQQHHAMTPQQNGPPAQPAPPAAPAMVESAAAPEEVK